MKRRMMISGALVALAACSGGNGQDVSTQRPIPPQLLPAGAREVACEGPFTTVPGADSERFCYIDAGGHLHTVMGMS